MVKENNRNDGNVKLFQKYSVSHRCWKMNHRHRIALKIDHRRGLHAPDVCTLGRPCTSWRRSPWCTWLYPRSGRCSCCSRSSTWKHSLSGCQETVNRWLGDRCQVEQARETRLSPTWWEYPWSSLHTLLHSFVPHTTSPPILFYQMLYTSDYIFFLFFLHRFVLLQIIPCTHTRYNPPSNGLPPVEKLTPDLKGPNMSKPDNNTRNY